MNLIESSKNTLNFGLVNVLFGRLCCNFSLVVGSVATSFIMLTLMSILFDNARCKIPQDSQAVSGVIRTGTRCTRF